MPTQPDQAQQDERPTEFIPFALVVPSMPQATSTDPPVTPLFHQLHLLHWRTLSPWQTYVLSRNQHTTILRQIQQHLGLPPPQTDIPGPSEPVALVEETIRVNVRPQSHSRGSH
ncbi:hypothetical protein CK203_059644 [Vitis vinifera]|uniref:Uncharacterized protein n=1 Tax=Vitis vinifera TaxID=29760 RepID=A0A438H0J0_VITVI|nr:hypothetical protein CK203_059644 [Vitis vinifera]